MEPHVPSFVNLNRVFNVASAALLLWFAGCDGNAPATSNGSTDTIEVVATVGMVADIVKIVGGDRVQVTQLMGPGVDPHLYKPTRDDARRLMTAELIVCSGLMLEGRMQDVLTDVGQKQPVVIYTDPLPHDQLLTPDDSSEHPDPHVWMDVAAWSTCISSIVDGLGRGDPEHKAEFQTRADALRKELATLHEYGLTCMASIPKERRILITSHDAFSYFGRAYGLEVVGVQGLSTESEAGLQRINELVDLIVERKVSAVFVESSVPPKNIQALIDGAKSRGHDVQVGG